MSLKVVLINISRGFYDHSQNPPQSPFIKRGGRRFSPLAKGKNNNSSLLVKEGQEGFVVYLDSIKVQNFSQKPSFFVFPFKKSILIAEKKKIC